jgi:hypothetical protein
MEGEMHTEDSAAVAERFWAKVDRSGGPDSCWRWTASVNHAGYGKFWLRGSVRSAAHVAWELCVGAVPEGMCVLHRCDVGYPVGDTTYRRCVNVAHLWLGTRSENSRDMVAKGRVAAGDRSPTRLHPERRPYGDRNGSRTHPERLGWGEANPQAKLTAADVTAIRRRYAAGGISQRALAAEMGVCQGTISHVVRGNAWRHVVPSAHQPISAADGPVETPRPRPRAP